MRFSAEDHVAAVVDDLIVNKCVNLACESWQKIIGTASNAGGAAAAANFNRILELAAESSQLKLFQLAAALSKDFEIVAR